ncbi:MAG: diguanylate cyclase [Polyangiaceae bacterium]
MEQPSESFARDGMLHEGTVAESGESSLRAVEDAPSHSLVVGRIPRRASPDASSNSESEQLALYRLGIEAAPTGLLMVDGRGCICLVNRQIERMFGYSSEELLGQSVDVLIPHRFRAAHSGEVRRFFTTPTAERAHGQGRDLFGVRKDGSEFAVEIGLNPLPGEEGARVLASVVDITARKAQELELRARVAELQRYQEEMDLLSEMSSLLQHALREQEAHDIVAGFGRRLLRSVDVAVYSLRASRDTLELKSHWGDEAVPDGFSVAECWAMRRTQVHRAEAEHADRFSPRCAHGPSAVAPWQTCIPMSAHGQSSGVLSLSSSRPVSDPERRNLEQVGQAIADQLALALSNIRLRESLRDLAIRDPLTGLLNRRYLQECVARELPRAERHDSPVSVWMIDIDYFKRFNDTHGHLAADEALVRFGKMLLDAVRDEDVACRFGGEEFVVLLPDCRREDAAARAEQLRQRVVDSRLGFTLSIGVSEWPRDGRSWDVVLRKADDAVYVAKAAGRNQVHASATSTSSRPE